MTLKDKFDNVILILVAEQQNPECWMWTYQGKEEEGGQT